MRKLTLKLACLTLFCALTLPGPFVGHQAPEAKAQVKKPDKRYALTEADRKRIRRVFDFTVPEATAFFRTGVTGIPISIALQDETFHPITDVAVNGRFRVVVTIDEEMNQSSPRFQDGILLRFIDHEENSLIPENFIPNDAMHTDAGKIVFTSDVLTNNPGGGHTAIPGHVIIKALRGFERKVGKAHTYSDRRHVWASAFKSP